MELLLQQNDFICWLDSLQEYVKETDPDLLDLSYQPFGIEQLKSILKVVANSEISELAVAGNEVDINVLQLLTMTKVKKFSIGRCRIPEDTLMEFISILKDTQITHLYLSYNSVLSPDFNSNIDAFKQCLQASKLVSMNLCEFHVPSELIKALPQLFTSLHITYFFDTCNHLSDLFSHMGALTELTIAATKLSVENIGILVRNLVNSKLEKLSFEYSEVDDAGVEILAKGLVHSNVSVFSLKGCKVSNLGDLVPCFQSTHLKELDLSYNDSIEPNEMLLFSQSIKNSSLGTLNLGYCKLDDKIGQLLMRGLACSKLSTLDVSRNNFGLPTILELAHVISNTSLVNLVFYKNKLSNPALIILQGCIKTSQLKQLDLSENLFTGTDTINTFLENVASNLQSVNIGSNKLYFFPGKVPNLGVKNTSLTHLDLSWNNIEEVMKDLAENLKHTVITHLNLKDTGITDDSAEILANCLEDTQIVDLNLSNNSITGGKAIPPCVNRTKLIHLDLSRNSIKNTGLQLIAQRVEGSFITDLNVRENTGKRHLLIESVLWHNRIRSHNLISFFKQIAQQTNSGSINFNQGLQNKNVTEFLEECLQFYKTISEQPAAVSVLTEESTIPFSRTEIVTFSIDKFPTQFAAYIGTRIEADASVHVEFLKQVEDKGLAKIVEALLLNRPNYTIDKENGILHHYVYKLLLKYKQPICNLGIEPEGINKITAFFNQNSEFDGVQEIVTLLSNLTQPNGS